MPLSKAHKEKTRIQIVEAAAALFRAHGYNGVSIDDIMAQAGLTRGGFYAHFDSKADLFAQVLALRPGLARMLSERQGGRVEDIRQGTLDVLATYLDPDNIGHVTSTCPMASLARDVDHGGAPARAALTGVVDDLLDLLRKAMRDRPDRPAEGRALAVLALCVGGVTIARTAADAAHAARTLRACEDQARLLLMD